MTLTENGDESVKVMADTLQQSLDAEAILITRGSRGMALFEKNGNAIFIPVYGTDQVADVTGAGDTVIATFTLAHGLVPLIVPELKTITVGGAVSGCSL